MYSLMSIVLIVSSFILKNETMMLASGLFAIASAIPYSHKK